MWQDPNNTYRLPEYGAGFMGGAGGVQRPQGGAMDILRNYIQGQTVAGPQHPVSTGAGATAGAAMGDGGSSLAGGTGAHGDWQPSAVLGNLATAGDAGSHQAAYQRMYDLLNQYDEGRSPGQNTWVDQYKDMLLNQIIPAAMKTFGEGAIMQTYANNPFKAWSVAGSAVPGGIPFYDKTGDGSAANLLYVPGFAPQGAPSQIQTQGYSGPGVIR